MNNSQPTDPSKAVFPLAFPESNSLAGLFGLAPMKAGFYGNDWGDVLILSTNHRPSLCELGRVAGELALSALALESGGFGPADALALGCLEARNVEGLLAAYSREHSIQSGRLLVPARLARKFGWTGETRLSGWTVRVVPGRAARLPDFLKKDKEAAQVREPALPAFFQRLVIALRLWLLQALLFAGPLLVFGWQALVLGLAGLLAAALLLGLAWPILPGRGWLKGLVLGVLLAGGAAYALVSVLQLSYLPALGVLLLCAWMGVVFTGARA